MPATQRGIAPQLGSALSSCLRHRRAFGAAAWACGESVRATFSELAPADCCSASSNIPSGAIATVAASSDLAVFPAQLHDQSQLALSQGRLDRADDPGAATDHHPLTHLERPLARQMAGGDQLRRHDAIHIDTRTQPPRAGHDTDATRQCTVGAMSRGVSPAVYASELFTTGHDEANRAAVAAVAAQDFGLVESPSAPNARLSTGWSTGCASILELVLRAGATKPRLRIRRQSSHGNKDGQGG